MKPFNEKEKQSLYEFFNKIKEFGESTARQFISSEIGDKQVREADTEKIFCQYLYRHLTYKQGHLIETTSLGMVKCEAQTDGKWENQQLEDICAWSTF